jgi:hypothetical protein
VFTDHAGVPFVHSDVMSRFSDMAGPDWEDLLEHYCTAVVLEKVLLKAMMVNRLTSMRRLQRLYAHGLEVRREVRCYPLYTLTEVV